MAKGKYYQCILVIIADNFYERKTSRGKNSRPKMHDCTQNALVTLTPRCLITLCTCFVIFWNNGQNLFKRDSQGSFFKGCHPSGMDLKSIWLWLHTFTYNKGR